MKTLKSKMLSGSWLKTCEPLNQLIYNNYQIITNNKEHDSIHPLRTGWRIALIVSGLGYTALGILLFGLITGVSNIWLLFTCVACYFILLMGFNFFFHKTIEQKIDYTAHLATLGLIESSLFVATALIAKLSGLPQLMFASQGAIRLFAYRLHAERVKKNNYATALNYAFGGGAIALIVYLAIVLR